MENDIRLQFLGGSNKVGSLSMMLETNGTRLLFDYGMTPSKPPTFPMQPPPVDHMFLSHSHLDHSGMTPYLCSRDNQKINTTKLTAEISNLLHKDSIKIAKMEGYAPLYNMNDVKQTKTNTIPVEPNKKKFLEKDHEIRFHSAGHIPGSLMFELVESRNFLFTGDFNIQDTNLVKGTKPIKCDILCMEGTYAGRDHPKKREELEKEMIDKIEEVIMRGGLAILPAFAVSRSQELVLILKNSGFNIWYDGMGRKVSEIFLKYPKYLRSEKNLRDALNRIHFVHSEKGRKTALKSDVIITSSGMMDGGPVLSYMNKVKNDAKSSVILTGYQIKGTNSRLLIDKKKLDFYGVIEKVACEVDYFDFSGHAGHSELIEFAKKCNPEKIILMHSDNREALRKPLSEFADVYTPNDGEILDL
ncbi:MAG: MBL fold metallo-hydrolase [Thermoplasmatales archaeon]|nr:MBL fold metallo-hydrolase [Thermoplasmatales archaeon]